jgi:hypothetical protein
LGRLLVAIVVLAALFVSSCGNGGDQAVPPCHMPDSIQRYRVTVTAKMDMPGLDEALQELGSGNDPDPLAPWLNSLADLRLEGLVVLPDGVQLRLTFSRGRFDGLDMTAVLIGDSEWVKDDAAGWKQSTPYPEGLAPVTDLCEGANPPEEMALKAREQTVNGVLADHYRLDNAQFKDLGDIVLAGDTQANWDAEGLRHEGIVDYWLAEDGSWPVRVDGQFTLEYGQMKDVKLSVLIDVTDINDPDIKIEPPVEGD